MATELLRREIVIPQEVGDRAQLEHAREDYRLRAGSAGGEEASISACMVSLIDIMLAWKSEKISYAEYMAALPPLGFREDPQVHEYRVMAWNRACQFNYGGVTLEPWLAAG